MIQNIGTFYSQFKNAAEGDALKFRPLTSVFYAAV